MNSTVNVINIFPVNDGPMSKFLCNSFDDFWCHCVCVVVFIAVSKSFTSTSQIGKTIVMQLKGYS